MCGAKPLLPLPPNIPSWRGHGQLSYRRATRCYERRQSKQNAWMNSPAAQLVALFVGTIHCAPSLVRNMTQKLVKSPLFVDSITLRPQDPNAGKPTQYGPGFAEWLHGPTKKVCPHFFAPDDRSCPRLHHFINFHFLNSRQWTNSMKWMIPNTTKAAAAAAAAAVMVILANHIKGNQSLILITSLKFPESRQKWYRMSIFVNPVI